jgi:hypothetical protein
MGGRLSCRILPVLMWLKAATVVRYRIIYSLKCLQKMQTKTLATCACLTGSLNKWEFAPEARRRRPRRQKAAPPAPLEVGNIST